MTYIEHICWDVWLPMVAVWLAWADSYVIVCWGRTRRRCKILRGCQVFLTRRMVKNLVSKPSVHHELDHTRFWFMASRYIHSLRAHMYLLRWLVEYTRIHPMDNLSKCWLALLFTLQVKALDRSESYSLYRCTKAFRKISCRRPFYAFYHIHCGLAAMSSVRWQILSPFV